MDDFHCEISAQIDEIAIELVKFHQRITKNRYEHSNMDILSWQWYFISMFN